MSTLRRVLVAILFLCIIGALGFAVYYLFFKSAPPETTGPQVNANSPTGGGLPTAGSANTNAIYVPPSSGGTSLTPASPVAKGGPTISPTVVQNPTLGAMLASDGASVRYYDRATGKFMSVDPNGNVVELSAQIFPSVQNVTWSADGARAVMEFPDGTKLSFNFASQKQATLPASWEDFSFSPGSDKLAAKQVSDSAASRYLVVSNADGSGARPVAALGDNSDQVTVSWSPAGDVLALSDTGDTDMTGSFGERQMLFVGQNGENFPATLVEGQGFIPLWSPDGSYLLYSAASSDDDFRPRLYAVTGSGANRGSGRRTLNLMTFVDKCSFASSSVAYCAVPDALPEGIGLERGALGFVPDSVFKVDISTGLVTLVGRPETDTMISSLTVSKDGSTLFFTDAANGSIKKMMLR